MQQYFSSGRGYEPTARLMLSANLESISALHSSSPDGIQSGDEFRMNPGVFYRPRISVPSRKLLSEVSSKQID